MRKHSVRLFSLPLFFILLASFTPTQAPAAPLFTDAPEHWIEVQTPHFTVLSDAGEKQARHVAGQFEQMRSIFHTLIPDATADSGFPITVLALRNKKDFQSIEPPAYLAKNQLNLAGLFMHPPDKVYILLRLDAEGEHPFATVYHEYTHLMLSKAVWLPLWLNEGLAQFYENTTIREKEVILGQPDANTILYLRDKGLIPLATLLAVDHASPYYHDEQKGSVFYAESWALTHYIQVTDREKNTNHLEEYARRLAQHEDPVTAAQSVFGDLKQLQKSLDAYIRQGSFRAFQLKTAISVDEAAFRAAPVTGAHADAIRADVLADNDRTLDSEALLDTILHEDPTNELAHETMGQIKYREGNLPAAKKWYSEAVQLDSQSFLAHFYFAMMSINDGDTTNDAGIESSLRAAIKLNPSFAPSYDALAMFYLSRRQKLPEAHVLNARAIELDPANLNFRLNAAEVLAQQNQFAGALGILKRAEAVAKTPTESAIVQDRVQHIQQYVDTLAANKAAAQTTPADNLTDDSAVHATPDDTHVSTSSKVIAFQNVNGKMTGTEAVNSAVTYPTANSTGPKHTVDGVIRTVQCIAPAILALSFEHDGATTRLYTNNFYKVEFSFANYNQTADLKPCTDIGGMKARIQYAEVTNPNTAGQILTVALSK